MPAHDLTIMTMYSVNYSKLTYIWDGEVYAEQSIPYGEVIVLFEVKSDEILTFNGWEKPSLNDART